MITGFINALGSFATEALGSEMQSLTLQTGEQLFAYPYKETSIIGIAITDAKDHPKLVQKLLVKILMEFSTTFQTKLEQALDVTQFEEFTYTIDLLLKGKVSSRTKLKMFFGVLAGLLLIYLIATASIPVINNIPAADLSTLNLSPINFSDGLDPAENITLQLVTIAIIVYLMVYFSVLYFLPAFFAAYIAGNRKRGVWTALFLGASIFVLFLLSDQSNVELGVIHPIYWYIAFSPLLISLSVICGIYGGRWKEKRKLYPLER